MNAREILLSYAHDAWRATGAGLDVTHAELDGLERLIAEHWAEAEVPVVVELRFDMSALPRWLHQYHAHYCNYRLRLPRGARA